MFSKKYANNYTMEMIKSIFIKEKFQQSLDNDDFSKFKKIYTDFNFDNINSFNEFSRKLNFKYDKQALIKMYRYFVKEKQISRSPIFEKIMVKKATRGHSGVNVVTIFTSPTQFGNNSENEIKRGGCPKDCRFCPFEKDKNGTPTQPRSYLSTEPGNMRATQNLHHPVGQMFDRIFTLEENGHIAPFFDENKGAKLEIIISGGTFNFYPRSYIIWFVTCMYFSANVYEYYRENNKFPRDILSLEEEQKINETAPLRVIGLTIETRPDYLNPNDFDSNEKNMFAVLELFRELGVTRVQIGLQHTNDEVLKYVNRQCTDEKNREAIYFLKQNGFKADGHWMLDLPMPPDFDPIETDIAMLKQILSDPSYELDQWKIYPTEVTPYTKILEWYQDGTYRPYAELENGKYLEDVIIEGLKLMKPWIRVNRIIRDIPVISIEGGIMCPDMRNRIEQRMKINGLYCKCIRCREIKLGKVNYDTVVFKKRVYEASNGTEYFLSFETDDEKTILGYLRLRINHTNDKVMPHLHNTGLIRELHVLGKHTEINLNSDNAQHKGYGKRLVKTAEEICKEHGLNRVAIIAGIGVREYYRKLGYKIENTYMVKNIYSSKYVYNRLILIGILIGIVILILSLFI
jgi:elongator complex protein 3